MTWRVDKVDLVLVPIKRGGRRGDGDPPLALLVHVIHLSGAVVNLADLVRFARKEQKTLRHRGLAGVDMGRNPYIPHFVQFGHRGEPTRQSRNEQRFCRILALALAILTWVDWPRVKTLSVILSWAMAAVCWGQEIPPAEDAPVKKVERPVGAIPLAPPIDPSTSSQETDSQDSETNALSEQFQREFTSETPNLMATPMSTKEKVAWVSTTVAAGTITAGLIFAFKGNTAEQDIRNLFAFRDALGQPVNYSDVPKRRYEELVDQGERYNTTSIILLSVGGAAALTATTLFILDAMDTPPDEGVKPSLQITPESATMGVGWSF